MDVGALAREMNLTPNKYMEYVNSGGTTRWDDWVRLGGPATYGLELAHVRDITPGPTPELANEEHAAFARDIMKDHPYIGMPFLIGAIPAYQALKAIGWKNDEKTTPASLDQMASGYRGMWRGLGENLGTIR